MRKCSRSGLGWLAAALLVLPAGRVLAQGAEGTQPESVSIRLEKDVILPGDLVEVELSNFRDDLGRAPHPEHRLTLAVLFGEIDGGKSGNHFVGDGTVKVQYRAPYSCSEHGGTETLFVWTGPWQGSADRTPLDESVTGDLVEEYEFSLGCPTYALLEYKDYVYFDHAAGPETSLVDISVVVRLTFPQRFFGEDYMTIDSVDVLSFTGKTRHQYADDPPEIQTLVSAHPSTHGTTAPLHRDAASGKITAVEFPLISVTLGWRGTGGVPPDIVDIQPVTEQSESEEDRWEEMADNLEELVGDADEELVDEDDEANFAIYAQVMEGFNDLMGARLLPDHQVRQGDGITYCAGQGNLNEEIEPDGVMRKSYKWELFLADDMD